MRFPALPTVGFLLCCLAPAASQPLAAPVPLRDRIDAIVKASGAEVAVAFQTLDGRDGLMLDEDVVFHAASTMKVPVMVELFRQAAAGSLSLDARIPIVNQFRSVVDGSPYSLSIDDDSDADIYKAIGTERSYRELCEAMITVSSNLATNLLIDRLGAENVYRTMLQYGADGMRVRRGVEDGKAFQQGLNNTATARAFNTILLAIARGETVSAAASEEMQAILKRQKFNDAIPAGLPPGTVVGHKTGSITKVNHDGGIVYGPRPYVLVVLTRGIQDEKQSAALIAQVARVIHEGVR
jgi:beta-lactamase class A